MWLMNSFSFAATSTGIRISIILILNKCKLENVQSTHRGNIKITQR